MREVIEGVKGYIYIYIYERESECKRVTDFDHEAAFEVEKCNKDHVAFDWSI